MYKAIKDNRIIGISDTSSDFFCSEYEVVEDTEHTTADYEMYFYDTCKSEYLLKSEIPAPTKEEQQAKRKAAYEAEIDELHAQKMRHQILGDWTEEDEAEYEANVIRLSQEIAERYPYPEEEVDNE